MSGALSQVWGMINGLQLFVHIPLFNINLPANAHALVDQMITIATFDIVEPEFVFDGIFEFPEENEEDLNEKFSESGYDSAFMINLLGMGFIVLVITVMIMMFLLIFWPFKGFSKSIMKVHTNVSSSIFWGFWLRFIIEDSLIALIAVFCDRFNSN